MVVELTSEQEGQLLEIATAAGKSAEEVASDVLDRALAAKLELPAGVNRDRDAAPEGRPIESKDVWARVEAILRL